MPPRPRKLGVSLCPATIRLTSSSRAAACQYNESNGARSHSRSLAKARIRTPCRRSRAFSALRLRGPRRSRCPRRRRRRSVARGVFSPWPGLHSIFGQARPNVIHDSRLPGRRCGRTRAETALSTGDRSGSRPCLLNVRRIVSRTSSRTRLPSSATRRTWTSPSSKPTRKPAMPSSAVSNESVRLRPN